MGGKERGRAWEGKKRRVLGREVRGDTVVEKRRVGGEGVVFFKLVRNGVFQEQGKRGGEGFR